MEHNISDLKGKIPLQAQFFGQYIMKYVFDRTITFSDNIAEIESQFTLDDWRRVAVLDDLYEILKQQRGNFQTPVAPDFMNFAHLKYEQPAIHPLRHIRKNSEIHNETDDALIALLKPYFLDAFPASLFSMAHERERFIFPSHTSLSLKSGDDDLLRQVILNDESLQIGFPEIISKDIYQTGRLISLSTGLAGSLQPVLIPTYIYHASLAWTLINGDISESGLMNCATLIVDKIRKAFSGETVDVPVVHIYDGIGLKTEQEIILDSGVIKIINLALYNALPPGVRPPMSDAGIIGAALYTHASYKVEFFDREDNLLPSDLMAITDTSANEAWPLLTAIHNHAGEVHAARYLGTIVIDPLNLSMLRSSRFNNQPGNATILNEDAYNDLKIWASKLDGLNNSGISVAVRRFLSASAERVNDQDKLIDSVIGLENLFGERSDISLTIASCAAKLLESDFLEREKIFALSKKIYDLRSHVVHGRSIKNDDIRDFANHAKDILRRVFRALIDHPDDLINIKRSERVKQILLS